MPIQIRSLAARLSKSVTRIKSPRVATRLPLVVSLENEENAKNISLRTKRLTITGNTQELGQNELSFVVSAIRLGEHYLAGNEQRLRLEVELPEGAVQMTVVAICYEQVEIHNSVSQYLIEARIENISDSDRQFFNGFLKQGLKSKGNSTFEKLQPENAKPSLIGQFFGMF